MSQANQPIHKGKCDNKYRVVNKRKFLPEIQLVLPFLFLALLGCCFILLGPECVHVCVGKNHGEGEQKTEQQPDINHLHVGGLGQVVGYVNEDGGQH